MAEAVVAENQQDLELCEGAVGFSPQTPQYPTEVVYQYSSNDVAYQYNSLAQGQILDPSTVPDGRRKSVASVQTGGPTSAPRHPVKRRRSETVDRGKHRRHKTEDDYILTSDGYARKDEVRRGNSSASEGGRRAHRNSHPVGSYDLESARMSGSSGHYYKSDHMNGNPDSQDQDEQHRSRVVVVCASIAVGIFLTAILLVAITLRMSPAIDEMVRKENEDILRELQGVSASTVGLNTTVQPSEATEDPTQT